LSERRQAIAPEIRQGQAASTGQPAVRWSDPFERLSVGQRFQGGERTISDTDLIVFCALTGDWHPQHCDPEWAASSPFGERIAHGMLILSLAVGLVPLDPERVLALRRVSDVVFKRAVRLGDVIAVAGELTACRSIDEHSGLVDFSWSIRNQDRALVCRASVQVLWRRDSPVEGPGRGFWHEAVTAGSPPDGFIPLPL
jgi:3-hydroxybutyryl-CoA dehydratase